MLRRARSRLTATRIRSTRSSGSGTGPRDGERRLILPQRPPFAGTSCGTGRDGRRCAASRGRSAGRRDTPKTSLAWRCSCSSRLLSQRQFKALARLAIAWSVGAAVSIAFKTGAPAHQPRLHRPQIHALDLCDFLVDKSFDIAQNQRGSKWLRHLAATPLRRAPGSPRAPPCRTATQPDPPACPSDFTGVPESSLRRSPARSESPAACAASTSAAGSKPRAARSGKSTCAAKIPREIARHPAENLHEDFLGQIGSVGAVMHGARQQRVNRLVIARDQPGKSLLRARRAAPR